MVASSTGQETREVLYQLDEGRPRTDGKKCGKTKKELIRPACPERLRKAVRLADRTTAQTRMRLPTWLRQRVDECRVSLQTPPDLFAMLALATAAGALARKFEAVPRDGW